MGGNSKIVKRNIKDSVFTSLFGDTKYIVQLYQALHPEAVNISEDVLKEYLSDHEQEVYDIMFKLFDDDYILNTSLYEAEQNGIQQGKQENMREIAFNLFKQNRSDEDIIDILDISANDFYSFREAYARQ